MNDSRNSSAGRLLRSRQIGFDSFSFLIVVVWCVLMLVPMTANSHAASPSEETKRVLAEAERRIRSIDDRREFRAAEFSAA